MKHFKIFFIGIRMLTKDMKDITLLSVFNIILIDIFLPLRQADLTASASLLSLIHI